MNLAASSLALGAFAVTFLAPEADAATRPKTQLARPDARPMVHPFSFAELSAKGMPLYCIFMRDNGSQFSTSMTLLPSPVKPVGGDGKMSVRIDASAEGLKSGTYAGAVGGVPLMEQSVFDLGKADGDPDAVLKLAMSSEAEAQIPRINFRTMLFKQAEDMTYASALGYCYNRDTVEATPRNPDR